MTAGGLLLMDEEQGRADTRRRGIGTQGALGVLIQVFRSGLIIVDQLRSCFDQIAERPDIWISQVLCQWLLQGALSAER